MASKALTLRQIAAILFFDPEMFIIQYNQQGAIYQAYQKGQIENQLNLQQIIRYNAQMGDPVAPSVLLQHIDKQRNQEP
jgi:hypothetical protein